MSIQLSTNENDPWGNRGSKRPSNQNDGPPDLDEILDKWRKSFEGLLGKKSNRGSGNNGNGSGGGNNSQNSPSSGVPIKMLLIGLIVIFAVTWTFFGTNIIDEKERAVVLRFGKYYTTLDPGFQWQPPMIDQVIIVNITSVRDQNFKGDMLTKDENIVQVALQMQYVVSSAKDFILNIRQPEQSLSVATDSALRHVVGSSTLDYVITTGRAQVAVDIRETVQRYLDNYGAGIQITGVNIQAAKPPDQVKPAFDDVIKAREDKVSLTNEATTYSNGIIPEARGKAKRIIEDALGYKESVIARSTGEAQRFLALLAEYQLAPSVTKKRLYVETMQKIFTNTSKVIVDVEGGNNILYLPLDQITKQSTTNFGRDKTISNNDTQYLTDQVVDELRKRQRNVSPNNNRNQTTKR